MHSVGICSSTTAHFLLWLQLSALVFVPHPLVDAQQGDECPSGWYEYTSICYRFSSGPTTVQMASLECEYDYAYLVSIRNSGEHSFVQRMLEMVGSTSIDWFTAGYRHSDGTLRWRSDNSIITTDFFPSASVRNQRQEDAGLNIEYNQIVYRYEPTNRTYVWAWNRLMATGGFICQIEKSETWRIYQQSRDFSYGTGLTDPAEWKVGPNITVQSHNILFFHTGDMMTPVILDCQASGNPPPTYKWYRQHDSNSERQEVTAALGPKYDITNGRLTISDPTESQDSSQYTCVATNEIGTVESNPISVSYGFLGEFSNDGVAPTPAQMYMGVKISCQNIMANTDLAYNWNQGTVLTFIRPETNPQYFLSMNGHLYISEVQAGDQGEYRCIVEMIPSQNQELAVNMAPSRTSLPINLAVQGENANTYGPDIQNEFPQFFPSIPMVGERVEIECLAYGRLPLYYSWRREDGPFNPDVRFEDHSRRLIIPVAQLEDTGAYTCVVKGATTTATKTAYLSLKARPSFPHPLTDQHLDRGSEVTLRCLAIAVPLPTYTWFRNGQKLVSNTADRITVSSNVLIISDVDIQHEGMYQCEATNSVGTARTSAQLRTLSFAPNFEASPVESTKQGAEGGDVTIACQPEAAPRATIRWERNGNEVGPVELNGDLHLTALTMGDAGTYTCVATNDLGEARSSCSLIVQAQSVFTERPGDLTILINETTTIPCRASFDRSKTDVIYSWTFNSHTIDFDGTVDERDMVTYSLSTTDVEDGRLYIKNAQFQHEGQYTCHVTSASGSIDATAYLTVDGPPGEPGGVHARNVGEDSLFKNEIELWWQEGKKHGFDVSFYIIEYSSIYDEDDQWTVLIDDLAAAETTIDQYPDWRGYWIRGMLSPGAAYYFRVRACNSQVGCSAPSSGPYEYYGIASAAPIYPPDNVGGGGGASGLLQMTWDPLPRAKWGDDAISYILYYRKKGDESIRWEEVPTTNSYHNVYVGLDNYYLQYEVKVQVKNSKGVGPNSTAAIVYSAEILPQSQPTNPSASGINATAGWVWWTPVPNTREAAHGAIGGYQINYWLEGTECKGGSLEEGASSINIYGDVGEGLVIGLDPGSANCVNIQFFNTAGLGPKTDNYYLEMTWLPPRLYPEYVTIISHGWDSARIFWKGISIGFGEEPIRGYRAWWWEVTEDIRTARIEDFGMTQTGVIHGLEHNIVYRLRMLAYSKGGEGAKSPDVFFTLGGQIRYDPLTQEVMNSAPRILNQWSHTILSIVICLIVVKILNISQS